eukprot:Pgem_evm1s3647
MNVTYDTSLFLVKNTDYLGVEFIELMSNSNRSFVRHLFSADDKNENSSSSSSSNSNSNSSSSSSSSKKATITSQFKSSLGELVETLSETETHFIRCLKPNKVQSGFLSHAETVVVNTPKIERKHKNSNRSKKGSSLLSFDGSMTLDQLHAS